MSTASINQAIKQEQSKITQFGLNAASNAADINPKVTMGPGGIAKVDYVRAQDINTLKAALHGEAEFGFAEIKNDFFQKINEAMGDPHGGKSVGKEGYEDAGSINHLFLAMIKKLDVSDVSEPQARERAVDAVTQCLSSIENYQNKLDNITTDLENNLQYQINDINSKLKSLYQNNSKITFRGDVEDNALISSSEDIVHDLSRYVNLNISFSDGRISARGLLGIQNLEWVNATQYVQFGYNPNSPDKISVSVVSGSTGSISQTFDVFVRDSDGNTTANVGGSLQGVLEFRDKDLAAAKADIQSAIENVAYGINKMHNEGAGFPPSSMISSGTVLSTDEVIGSGKFRIASFQENGQPLAANVLPIGVDIGSTNNVAELVDAINKEAVCASQAGAALGNNVDSTMGNYLIRQASLDLTNIDASGRAKFGMRLESGSDHDVQFRIKNAVITDANNGAGNAGTLLDNLPSSFHTLNAGDTSSTSKIEFDIPNAGNRRELHIYADVEVVGSDGTFALERVHFALDSGANNGLLNYNVSNYVQATAPAGWPGAINGTDAQIEAARTNAAQVTASVSDDNKLRIDGRAIIMNDDAVIYDANGKSKGVAHHFGLNDLMVKNANNRYQTRSDIVSDTSKLSWSKAQRMANIVDRTTRAGATSAQGNFSLVVGNAANNETLVINGETLTFKNAPVDNVTNPDHVEIGGNSAATITNLIARINSGAFPAISGLVNVSNNPNPAIMDITARFAGTKANAITLADTSANGVVSAGNLGGGTDAAATSQRIAQDFRFVLTHNENTFASSIHNAIEFPDGTTMNVRNAFDIGFLLKTSESVDESAKYKKVSETSADAKNKLAQDARKAGNQDNLIKVMNASQNMRFLSVIRHLLMEGKKMLVSSAA